MKIVYAGTPEFAVEPLKQILSAGYEVVAVVTQEDKPVGRKAIMTPPPVKQFALEHGIPVFQPKKIRNEADAVRALGGDIMVTCAFGQILSREILDIFPMGVWNIHASLLPKYRGASPIQYAVIDGEAYTGVTIMRTEEGMDTGDILLVKRTAIGENETAGELSERLSVLGGEAITEGLAYIVQGEPALLMQDESAATVVRKITKEQAKIDWTKDAVAVKNFIHGMNPSPVAYTQLNGGNVNVYRAGAVEYEGGERNGEVIVLSKKLAVKCGHGAVLLEEVQLPGGKKIRGADALNGRKIQPGQVLE